MRKPSSSNEALRSFFVFQRRFNQSFKKFIENELRSMRKRTPALYRTLSKSKRMLFFSGKRLRPYACYLGYRAGGGSTPKEALRAGMALELVHAFALVHDDIIDRAVLRRNLPTVSWSMQQTFRKVGLGDTDATHYGNASALLVGDYLLSLAFGIVSKISRSEKKQGLITSHFVHMLEQLIEGQYREVLATQSLGNITEGECLSILSQKSGLYTVAHPLQFGAIIAGKKGALTQQLLGLGVPLGIAFQIQDDLLSTFGQRQKTGKSLDGDIKEGKPTSMAIYALHYAVHRDQMYLKKVLGNAQATQKDIIQAKKIFIASGAKTYAKNLVQRYCSISRQRVSKGDIPIRVKKDLTALLDFICNRTY